MTKRKDLPTDMSLLVETNIFLLETMQHMGDNVAHTAASRLLSQYDEEFPVPPPEYPKTFVKSGVDAAGLVYPDRAVNNVSEEDAAIGDGYVLKADAPSPKPSFLSLSKDPAPVSVPRPAWPLTYTKVSSPSRIVHNEQEQKQAVSDGYTLSK